MNQPISKNRVCREYIVVYVVVKIVRQSTVAVGKGVLGYVTRASPSEVYRWVGFNMIFSSLTKHRICNKFSGTFERSKVPKTRRAVDPLRLQAGVSPSTEAIDGLFINVVIFWCLALRYFLQLIFSRAGTIASCGLSRPVRLYRLHGSEAGFQHNTHCAT